jgi:hypothetical protein
VRAAHVTPQPRRGKLAGKIVTCRAHAWRSDVLTGYVTSTLGFGVASDPLTVVDRTIMVAIGERRLKAMEDIFALLAREWADAATTDLARSNNAHGRPHRAEYDETRYLNNTRV